MLNEDYRDMLRCLADEHVKFPRGYGCASHPDRLLSATRGRRDEPKTWPTPNSWNLSKTPTTSIDTFPANCSLLRPPRVFCFDLFWTGSDGAEPSRKPGINHSAVLVLWRDARRRIRKTKWRQNKRPWLLPPSTPLRLLFPMIGKKYAGFSNHWKTGGFDYFRRYAWARSTVLATAPALA